MGGLVYLKGDEPRGPSFRIDGESGRIEVKISVAPPFRIWAMWMTFSGSFRRSITPFMWSRQDMSAEAMYSTPWRWKSWTRS